MAVMTKNHHETIRVVGSMSRADVAALVRRLERSARHGVTSIEVQLHRVPHADFRALPELFHVTALLAHRGCRVWASGASPYLSDLLRLAHPGEGEEFLHELEIDVDANLDPRPGVVNE
jgi:ABC-type transporter Mla MlaB component